MFERGSKYLGEHPSLGGCGGGGMVFAEVADQSHLDCEDPRVAVPSFSEFGYECTQASVKFRAVVIEGEDRRASAARLVGRSNPGRLEGSV
jgi:hypothetical protein